MRAVKTQKLVKSNQVSWLTGWKRTILLIAAITTGLLIVPALASAATLISQGYITESSLPAGSLVSLQKDSATHVDASNIGNVNNILGVVIGNGNSQLQLSSDQNNQVQVATTGVELVLVSDINGDIEPGDQITASPINGIGMKATGSTKVVGVAQGSFPNSTASEQTYKDKDNKDKTTKIGQVAVQVNVAYYYKAPEKTIIPSAIQNLANALAGKTVDSLPILISTGIFIVTLIVVVSIIYSMIHSSIISVGRNPMSQAAVYRNVMQLSLLVVIILAVSVVSIYMVLRRL